MDIRKVLKRNGQEPQRANAFIQYFRKNPNAINPKGQHGEKIKSIPAILEKDFKSKLRIYNSRVREYEHQQFKIEEKNNAKNFVNIFSTIQKSNDDADMSNIIIKDLYRIVGSYPAAKSLYQNYKEVLVHQYKMEGSVNLKEIEKRVLL